MLHRDLGRPAKKWHAPGQQCVHQHTQRVDVRAGIDGLAECLLGGDEVHSVTQDNRPRFAIGGDALQADETEVDDFDDIVGLHQDVARLDHAVQHASVVGSLQAIDDLQGEHPHPRPRHPTTTPQQHAEVGTFDVFADDVRFAFGADVGVQDLGDVVVHDRRGGPGFAEQPLDLTAVDRQFWPHDLDDDLGRRVDQLRQVGVGDVAPTQELQQVKLASEGGPDAAPRTAVDG